jgi:PPP family 3-phenylpropionic acid transporter
VPFAVAVATIMPLTETVAVAGVKSAGLDYGRMRLWGSLAFIGIGLLGGALIDRLGAAIGIWLIVAGAAATVVAGHGLPRLSETHSIGPERGNRGRGLISEEAAKLVESPVFLVFLLAAGAVQGAHAMFYTFGVLNWRAQGISTAWIGTLWAIGVTAEVLLFAYSGAAVRRLGPVLLLISGCAGAVLRWAIMSLNPPLALLLPLQLLHALTYGASHLGAIHFIARAVPEGAAGTAQALYATVAAGLMMGGATLVSGPLYAGFGGRAYLAMSLLAAAGLAASLIVLRHWSGGPLWPALPVAADASPKAPEPGAR